MSIGENEHKINNYQLEEKKQVVTFDHKLNLNHHRYARTNKATKILGIYIIYIIHIYKVKKCMIIRCASNTNTNTSVLILIYHK